MAADETRRIALIRYSSSEGTECVGSGLLINDRTVLTADHIAEGAEHRVDCLETTHEVGYVLRSQSSNVDLAVLSLKTPIPGLEPLRCARVDQRRAGKIDSCTALGFPRWKNDGPTRRTAQVDGIIPTGEGLEATAGDGLRLGLLTLVGNRKPTEQIPPGSLVGMERSSSWGGMSGAAVVAGGLVIGVVRSYNLAADGQSLTVTPLTAINDLPDDIQKKEFWEALGVPNPSELPLLPNENICDPLERDQGYQYDVCVSYWPKSRIDPWIRKRFLPTFRNMLFEELGRRPAILVARDAHTADKAILRSRVLLAILSRPFFEDAGCRALFESMLRRQTDEGFSERHNQTRLVHAIIAHDFRSDDQIPEEYRGHFEPINFKEWAYDFEIQDWHTNKCFNDAIGELSSTIADALAQAPAWHPEFPLCAPATLSVPTPRRPIF